jgi:branched-chain amino acid transport system substrate-binding protein
MTTTIKWITGLVAVVLVVIGVVSATGNNDSTDNTTEPVKVGVSLPVSGQFAYKGEQARNGIILAQEEINNEGGINGRPIEFIIEDNESSATKAASAAQKLINTDNVLVVLSQFTHLSSAIAPITKREDRVLVYQSTVTSLAESHDKIFKDYYSMYDVGSSFAEISSNQNQKQIAAIYAQSEWGKDFAEGLQDQAQKSNIEVEKFTFNPDAQNLRTVALKAKKSDSDTVAISALPNQTSKLLKSLKEVSWLDVTLLGLELKSDSISGDADIQEILNQTEAISSWFDFDPANPTGNQSDFVSDYEDKFEQTPRPESAYFYDEAHLLKEVLAWCQEEKQISSSCISERLKSGPAYDGVGGTVDFNQKGVSSRPVRFYDYEGGEWQLGDYTK